jgi:Pyruvate/2-oxoacid:ferredoxin oxidoreductase delta subunit
LFGEAVIDLYSVVKPHLAVMDGVVGMEGNGPSHGKPIPTNVILASYDSVSLDIVASRLIGLDPMTVPTTRAALERGFGTREPEVVGISLDEVAIKYKPSNGGILFNVPPVITRIFGKHYTVRPCIDTSKCILCGACAGACPVHAIENKNGKLRIDNERCILCYCCREMCPENAVASDRSLLARILANA